MRGSRLSMLAVAGLAAAVAAGAVYGTTRSSTTTIVGCKRADGLLRIVSTASQCKITEVALTWNAVGPTGPGGTGSTGPTGPTGPTGAPGADANALFGDGSDGDVTITSATTLTRDMYYDNLTINTGQTLNPGGYRIFVAGTLTLKDNSKIARNGNDGFGATPSAALAPGTLGGSGAGRGQFAGGDSSSNSLGGASAGFCNGGATVTPPSLAAGGAGVFRSALAAGSGRSLDGMQVNGGAGGGGGVTVGAGGSGGGVIVIAARNVALAPGASAKISADGGKGGGNACGGGGGVAVVITTSSQPAGVTLTAAGSGGSSIGPTSSPGFTDWLN